MPLTNFEQLFAQGLKINLPLFLPQQAQQSFRVMKLEKVESFADFQHRVEHMNGRRQRRRIYFVEQRPSNQGIRYPLQVAAERPR